MTGGKVRVLGALAASMLVLATVDGCGSSAPAAGEGPGDSAVKLAEKTIPSLDPGIKLYLRHKYLGTQNSFDAGRVILFLEPFSVPTAKAFDVPGYSWMDDYAKKGFDTWAMDFRGFGQSTRPAAMDVPAVKNKPVVSHEDGLADLTAVVNYIKRARHVDKIDIVGWSWGGVVGAEYAATKPENVNKLVLYGFMNGFNLPSMAKPYDSKKHPGEINEQLPAYQDATWPMAMHHWHMMVGDHPWVTPDAMNTVGEVYTASDPTSGQRDGKVRRPMGPLVDLYYIWTDRPRYSLSGITAPTLVIRGAADFFAEKGVLKKLTGASVKKEVVIPNASHWALYEKSRSKLLNSTREFLEDPAE